MRPAVGLLLFYKEKSEENENMKNYKIAVAGTGYVDLSLSVLLAQHNQVMAVDIVQAKVDMMDNQRKAWFHAGLRGLTFSPQLVSACHGALRPACFQGLMASGCALYLTHHSESW